MCSKLINFAVPDTIDARVINRQSPGAKPLSLFKRHENLTLAINSAQSIGCHVVNMDSHVLGEGRQHIVLGLIWQIIAVSALVYFANNMWGKKIGAKNLHKKGFFGGERQKGDFFKFSKKNFDAVLPKKGKTFLRHFFFSQKSYRIFFPLYFKALPKHPLFLNSSLKLSSFSSASSSRASPCRTSPASSPSSATVRRWRSC